MDEKEREIRKKLRDDFPHYASKCLKIRSKSGNITPLVLNRAQLYIHERIEQQRKQTGRVRAIILKGRQQGCSTYIEGRFYWLVSHRFGVRAFILTHDIEATNNLFEMAQRYHEYCPSPVRPSIEASNAKELIFGKLDSGYKLGTAGNKAVGRSSTIQLLHGSEVAYWPNAQEHAKGIFQAVSNEENTEIILESTANGIGNYFHTLWTSAIEGKSEYQAIFVPWYWQPEYTADVEGFRLTDDEEELLKYYAHDGLTKEHLCWRRIKINEFSKDYDAGLDFFKQEYPMSSTEAFLNPIENVFINSKYVMIARKNVVVSDSALIIGVDPAISDRDKTAIVRRKGRLVYNIEKFTNYNTMEIAGRLTRIIRQEQPKKVYIDCIGIGAGVVDRLKELGFQCVEGVNVGRTANDKEKYRNLRAELWATMRDWLMQDLPVQIPDDDELHGQLCSLGFKFNSIEQLQLESKDDLRARGMPSPDIADALSLTFFSGQYETQNMIPEQKMRSFYERGMFT